MSRGRRPRLRRLKERAVEGTMLWFNSAKRHGFIRTDGGTLRQSEPFGPPRRKRATRDEV